MEDDSALITEARDFLRDCSDSERESRTESLDDLSFVVGNQWVAQDKAQRNMEGRPSLTINKLPTFLHQVTNDQRQNIRVHPVEDADTETAEVLQGIVRHIEYASAADAATDTATTMAAAIGFGYWRLVTDYCAADSFDQDIKFKRVRNPFTVYFGPHQEADGSDAMRVMITETMLRSEFERQYPKAQATTEAFQAGVNDRDVTWITEKTVRVAEYYRVETKMATLVELMDGSTAWQDELTPEHKAYVRRKRESERRTVMLYKMTAHEVLERTQIMCDWIPVFPVYGDEWDIDGRVIRSGIIRWAKDPQRMYNYWMTAATEEVALRPKTPYIMAEGQDEGHENEWASANRRSPSRLVYKPVSLDGVLAPAPQRQPMADVPSGTLMMAMHASDNIKATMGLFDASLGAKGTARSGVQERSQQAQGDMASFHFTDNLMRAYRHCGRCLVNMIPHYYDAKRIVRIMGEDEKIEAVQINAPGAKENEQGVAIQAILNDLSVGTYDVTVSSGPAYSTMRQEAAEAMIQFGQSWPKLMDIAGDKVVKAMDWPGADEIAERIKRTIPPPLLGDEGEEQKPIPPEVQAHIQETEQAMQQATQFIQQLQGELQAAQAELANKEADRALDKYKNDTQNLTRIAIEEMKQPGIQEPKGEVTE